MQLLCWRVKVRVASVSFIAHLKLILSTLGFLVALLVLLHFQGKANPDSSVKKGRPVHIRRAWPDHLTRAHLPLFHFHPHMKSNWSVWKCVSDFSHFRFVFPNSCCVMCSRQIWLYGEGVTEYESGAGRERGFRDIREVGGHLWKSEPDTKDSTCLFSQQMNLVHPSEPSAQASYQSAARRVSGWEMTRSLVFRDRDSCLHVRDTEEKWLTDVVWSWLNSPKAKVRFPSKYHWETARKGRNQCPVSMYWHSFNRGRLAY